MWAHIHLFLYCTLPKVIKSSGSFPSRVYVYLWLRLTLLWTVLNRQRLSQDSSYLFTCNCRVILIRCVRSVVWYTRGRWLDIILVKLHTHTKYNLENMFNQKWKCHHLLIPMLMESRVKSCSPQNISRSLQHHSILVKDRSRWDC